MMKRMEYSATEVDQIPLLKMVACLVVSIAVLERWKSPDGVKLRLLSLPRDVNDPVESSERHIVSTFLDAVGFRKPQLVGFNSYDSEDRKSTRLNSSHVAISYAVFCLK